ncbi:COG4626 Phage terminase-like protein, large subunit [uncultured Caudovirales phage]|uniref:COG4626 Phage terminase-like protein, large subunit n=1 Tax=uncultured Caudovirales phage TaxID=2100421 RepID=A0A6J5RBJ7_9CAUD|nr:COG4626 Phage terminase-like protein, large subunit [uncultured Caudovirales phage]
MTRAGQGQKRSLAVVTEANRAEQGISTRSERLIGSGTPRIHSRLNDLPSRGLEIIDFSAQLGVELMPWQKFVFEHAMKVKPDGRWKAPVVAVCAARQNGKSTIMEMSILARMYLWKEPLQLGSAHVLTTSLETFRHIVNIIESHNDLSREVKKIRWAHGSEEIELMSGARYVVKAANAAARGFAKPETVYMDETRQLKDTEAWSAMRYTMMAAKNPQLWTFSNAGDQHSLILNQLRDRGMGSAAGSDDDIAYFEWSAYSDKITDERNWVASNPALGHTIHEDNIRAVLNDPPDVVQTEVLCRWVNTISGAIPAKEWNECGVDEIELDVEKVTWFGLDLSPDRRDGALVAAQKNPDDTFIIKLLHTWHNPISLDDKAIANDVAPYARKYPVEYVAFSKRTSSAVAARLQPAGIPIIDIDGSLYGQACDELLGAITSKRLIHGKQAELSKQILSAVRLPMGDGGWIIGRRASSVAVCAGVAAALATHFATRPEMEIDILVG